MTRTIQLSDDMIDGIVKDVLRQDLEMERVAIRKLVLLKKPAAFQLEDLDASIRISKALEEVLKYYGVAGN